VSDSHSQWTGSVRPSSSVKALLRVYGWCPHKDGLRKALAHTHRKTLENACRTPDKDFSTVSGELTDSGRIQVILAE